MPCQIEQRCGFSHKIILRNKPAFLVWLNIKLHIAGCLIHLKCSQTAVTPVGWNDILLWDIGLMILVAYSIILNWVLFCFAENSMTSSYCQRPPSPKDCQRLWATCSLLGRIDFKNRMSTSRYSWQKALKVLKNLYYTDTNTQILTVQSWTDP